MTVTAVPSTSGSRHRAAREARRRRSASCSGHAVGVAAGERVDVQAQRWSITKSAGALHREVLRPAGFDRRGTVCSKDDFLRRTVYCHAARFLPPEERTLIVGFGLEWVGLPVADLPEWAHVGVGGFLAEQYLQPTTGDAELDPKVVAEVAGPVLDYLERPLSPTQYVDQLLAYDGSDHPALFVTVDPSVHYYCAAWGSVLLADADRCSEALVRADRASRASLVETQQQDEEFPVGTVVSESGERSYEPVTRTAEEDAELQRRRVAESRKCVAEWHRDQVALIDEVWRARHGQPRPRSR